MSDETGFDDKRLGFIEKQDVAAGAYRCYTGVEPDQPNRVTILLEPGVHRVVPALTCTLNPDKNLFISFAVSDIGKELARLKPLNMDLI